MINDFPPRPNIAQEEGCCVPKISSQETQQKIRGAFNSLKGGRTQQYLLAARTASQIHSTPEKQDFQEHNPLKHRPYNIPANQLFRTGRELGDTYHGRESKETPAMKQLRFAAALAILIAAIAVPMTAFAGEWCVFDDGTHVHTSCGDYSDDEYHNRHSHDDDNAHAHPTHEFSEGNCVVHHAATPAQLCPSGDGLQYYFIGADGSSETGPYLPNQSSDSPAIQLYSGTNPMTGKSVVINWETDNGGKLRLSTYYPDNEYDTDKPYIFTVTENNIVTHVSW